MVWDHMKRCHPHAEPYLNKKKNVGLASNDSTVASVHTSSQLAFTLVCLIDCWQDDSKTNDKI